ncbi:hypothetical protein CCR94_23040 [Rhodoblastus sphagnicola]|uniref:Uncharacterized protein n=2 Tax=Rhodoblastus sphagnicola TaxID=333368 RepID=A0A2S6MUV0_9HYPH|nr:hypothetical protein CCR94_23040 [Rhodoblastus sphagnicola]
MMMRAIRHLMNMRQRLRGFTLHSDGTPGRSHEKTDDLKQKGERRQADEPCPPTFKFSFLRPPFRHARSLPIPDRAAVFEPAVTR